MYNSELAQRPRVMYSNVRPKYTLKIEGFDFVIQTQNRPNWWNRIWFGFFLGMSWRKYEPNSLQSD